MPHQIVSLVCLLASAAWCSGMSVLKVGLHFNLQDAVGNTDYSMVQALAAAMDQIRTLNAANGQTVRIYTQVVSGLGFSGAVAAGQQFRDSVWSSNGDTYLSGATGADVVITGGSDVETLALSLVLTDAKIMLLVTWSRDPLLEQGRTYQYTAALTPPLTYQGVVLQDIFCKHFQFSALSIFVVGDTDSIGSDSQFESNSTCTFNVLSRHILPATSSDYTAEIAAAKTSGANIFVIFGKADQTGALIAQAWRAGLFHEGVLVVSGERGLSPSTWAALKLASPSSVPLAFEGFLCVAFDPSFVLREDSFSTYPFHSGGVSGTCLVSTTYFGATFTATDGSDIYPYAAYAYDAPVLFMKAFDTMQSAAITGDTLRAAILALPSFSGASGEVKVQPGDATFNNRGSRLTGLTYGLFNFQKGLYQLHGDDVKAFSFNGLWTAETGLSLCTGQVAATAGWRNYAHLGATCGPLIFNTKNSSLPPVDHPPFSTSSLASPERVLKIGGIFSPFDDAGAFDTSQAQALAAFLMAVGEINASPKILRNIKLVSAIASAGATFNGGVLASQYLSKRAFGSTGVVAAVSAGVSIVTEAVNDVFETPQLPLVHTAAADVALENGGAFPYKLAVVPTDAYIGSVFQQMLCKYYKYRKVSIFATDDDRGAKTVSTFTDGTFCTFNVLSSYSFSEDLQDFSNGINAALTAGSRIFFFSMFGSTAGRLLLQGHRMGLFREGTQVFSGARMTTPDTWASWDPSLVRELMAGYVGIQVDPTYHVRTTPQGRAFVQAFQTQADTVSGPAGAQVCNGAFDDAGQFPLYQQRTSSGAFQCSGLQFRTSFVAPDGSDIYSLAAHAYDATWAVAYALDLVTSSGQTTVKSIDVFHAALNNVSFTGASGCMAFAEGIRIGGVPYHRGNRACGDAYSIFNFQASQFNPSNPTVGGFSQVGTWTLEKGVQLSSGVIYNTPDGTSPPLDTPLPIVVDQTPGLQIFLYIAGVLVTLAMSAVAAFVVVFRSTKLIKASQPAMLLCILAGGAVAGGRVIVGGLPLSDGVCAAQTWTGHLSFGLVFGALFLKTYRVHRIVNGTGFKRVKFTARDVLVRMAAVMALLVLYLGVAHGVGRIHASAQSTTVSNQTTELLLCAWRYDAFDTALYVTEAVILLMGARLCWATKDVPDAVNESKFIAYSMTILTLICALVFPIVFLINLSPAIQRLIASLAFAFGALFSVGILFGPKILLILTEGDIDGMDRKRKVLPVAGADEDDKSPSPAEGRPRDAVQGAPLDMAMLKGTLDQRTLLCRDQVKHWQALLMQLGERESSGDGSRGPGTERLPGAATTFENTAEQHFDDLDKDGLPESSDLALNTSTSGPPEEV